MTLLGEAPFPVKKIVMIAGGTGIAPIYNVVSEIAKDKEDKVEIVVLSCHRSVEDVLLKGELEKMRDRVKLYWMIDKEREGWDGFIGFVCREVLEKITRLDE